MQVKNLFGRKCSFRDIFLACSKASSFSYSLSKIKSIKSGFSSGVGVRIVDGDFTRIESFPVSDEISSELADFGLRVKKPEFRLIWPGSRNLSSNLTKSCVKLEKGR